MIVREFAQVSIRARSDRAPQFTEKLVSAFVALAVANAMALDEGDVEVVSFQEVSDGTATMFIVSVTTHNWTADEEDEVKMARYLNDTLSAEGQQHGHASFEIVVYHA